MVTRDRVRCAEEAFRAFARAAAALTEAPTKDVLVFALLEGSLAMVRLAEADADGEARDTLIDLLRSERARRGEGGA